MQGFNFNGVTYKTLSEALLAYWDAPDAKQQGNITRVSDGKVYTIDKAVWKMQ